jgi:hypothetical protein
MVYNPNIPQANDELADSQADLLNNFQALNNEFSVNHLPLTTVSAQAGYHTKVFFSAPLGSDPNLASPESSLYVKTVDMASQLFFQNGGAGTNVEQITGLTVQTQANTGTAGGTIYWVDTPWGLRLLFGTTNVLSASVAKTVLYPAAFSTVYTAVTSANDSNGTSVAWTTTTVALSLKGSDAVAGSYLVIGVL